MLKINIKYLVIVLISIIIYSCDNHRNKKTVKSNKVSIYSKKYIKKDLIQRAINNYRIKEYFDQFKDKKLYILSNNHFDANDLKLKLGDSILEVLNNKLSKDNKNVYYLDFLRVDIKKDSAFIDFYFNYSYVTSENIFSFENQEWKLVSSRIAKY